MEPEFQMVTMCWNSRSLYKMFIYIDIYTPAPAPECSGTDILTDFHFSWDLRWILADLNSFNCGIQTKLDQRYQTLGLIQRPTSTGCVVLCLRIWFDFFAPQEGLPWIRDGIEAAWREGRGELTDEQVSQKLIRIWNRLILNPYQSVSSWFKSFGFRWVDFVFVQVGALLGWKLTVTPQQGGDLSEQAKNPNYFWPPYICYSASAAWRGMTLAITNGVIVR